MPMDLMRITGILQQALLRDLGDEVDLIFRYGSQLKGTTHAYSDLDISYVPVHEETGHHITVLVDDVLCDLYPIRWSSLERMAEFENVSSSVLLDAQIVYQRNEAVAERFRALGERLRVLQQPAARPTMLRKAQQTFQRTGYPYYLLREAAAQGHLLACLQQAQQIRQTVLHALAQCNQACVDTRKREQVLALPRLPVNLAETLGAIADARQPSDVLASTEHLLHTTCALLLAEQRQVQCSETTYSAAFDAGYPELKGDLQHILLACERRDMFALTGPLISLYHELMIRIAQIETGVDYSDFNSLADYEQDLVACGFPALLPHVASGDFDELHRQSLLFDQHLQQFLIERGVNLFAFATVDDLEERLRTEHG